MSFDPQEKIHALHRLWIAKRAGRVMPARSDFSLGELGTWIANMSLLEPIDDGIDFRFRYHGSNLIQHRGTDYTGRLLSEIDPTALLTDEYRSVLETNAPVQISRSGHLQESHLYLTKMMFPLSPDGRSVNEIFSIVYFIPRGAPLHVPGWERESDDWLQHVPTSHPEVMRF